MFVAVSNFADCRGSHAKQVEPAEADRQGHMVYDLQWCRRVDKQAFMKIFGWQ